MSVAEKLREIAENEQKVFIAGQLLGEKNNYPIAYENGRKDGYDEGYDKGEVAGYNNGLAVGTEEGYSNGYENGIKYGEDAARMECESKHYTAVVVGDGTRVLKIPDVPFKPDLLSVCALDNDLRLAERQMSTVVLNFRSLDYIFGFTYLSSGPISGTMDLGYYTAGMLATIQMNIKTSFEADGSIVLKNFLSNNLPVFFAAGVGYLVQASKVIEKSDKERITDVINRLPAGGAYTITLPKAVKEEAFTSEEWKALIATKSTYTITLF